MDTFRNSGYDRKDNDAYYTPKGFVDVLCQYYNPHTRTVYDPACGTSDLIHGVKSNYPDSTCYGTDIVYGQDFFDIESIGYEVDIITNPPYGREVCEKFVRHALEISDYRATCAFLLRNDWDSSSRRVDLFGVNGPMYMKIVVNKRFPWIGGTKNGGQHNHSWYLFSKSAIGDEPLIKYGPYV